MPSVQELITDVSDLISLPEIATRITEMVDDANSSADDIAKVIAQDPGLAARLLKIANSPLFGLAKEISSIPRAVTILGTKQLRDLVVSTTASHAFDGIPNELISLQNFWRHSLYCGLLSQTLASHSKPANTESMFIAGLLHDIGQLVMFNRMPTESTAALMLVLEGPEELEMYEAEQRVFGFDHTQVGSELIKSWHLPDIIQECVALHHTPELAVNYPAEVAIVHIANAAAVMAELHSMSDSDDLPRIHPSAWQACKLSPDILEDVIESTAEEFKEIEQLLFA
jgi:putative nucleotidyltransferase with HDIG domain